MGTCDLCWVPLAAVRYGRARQTTGTRPCGNCRSVMLVPGPRGQYSGKIHFIEKPAVQVEGVAMWLNVVLTPCKPNPVKLQGQGASCGYCSSFAPLGVSTRGKFV